MSVEAGTAPAFCFHMHEGVIPKVEPVSDEDRANKESARAGVSKKSIPRE